jgi:hypothetical protein
LGYKKNIEKIRFNLKVAGEKSYPLRDDRGSYRIYKLEEMSATGMRGRETMVYVVCGLSPREGKQWQIGESKIKEFLERKDLYIEDGCVNIKIRPEDEDINKYVPFWSHFFDKDIYGTAETGKAEVLDIMRNDNEKFETVKPSKLISKLLFHIKSHKIANLNKSDIILDSFAGSGTTAHAVLDLNKEDGGNRKFILVEMEDYADKITAERVRRVIRGVPTAKDEKLKAGLGGSFTFCNLGKEISIEKIIAGESLPDYGALANYVFYTATGKSLDRDAALRADYFVGETDLYEVYLIYQPDTTFLRSNESALNDVKLKAIADRGSKKEKLVFATAKYMGQRELSAHNITFCQLPYAIHKVVGA